MIDLHKLQQFVTLARSGSYVRAAADLHLSQSGLSRNIQSLERQYGVQLVERARGRSGIDLTPEGHALLRRSQELLRRASEIDAELTNIAHIPMQHVSIGLGPMLASVVLTEGVLPLLQTGERVAIDVSIEPPSVMLDRLLAGELDFYLGLSSTLSKSHPRVRHEVLGTAPPTAWVRPGHPLLGRNEPTGRDLQQYPVLTGHAWNETVVPHIEDDELRAALTASVQIDNFDVLARLAEASDSVLISTARRVDSTLVELKFVEDLPVPHAQLFVVTLGGIDLHPAACDVRERLTTAYQHAINRD